MLPPERVLTVRNRTPSPPPLSPSEEDVAVENRSLEEPRLKEITRRSLKGNVRMEDTSEGGEGDSIEEESKCGPTEEGAVDSLKPGKPWWQQILKD